MGSFGRGLFWKEGCDQRKVPVGGDVILEYFVVPDNFCFGIHPKFLSFEIKHHALDVAKSQPTLKANKGMKKRRKSEMQPQSEDPEFSWLELSAKELPVRSVDNH